MMLKRCTWATLRALSLLLVFLAFPGCGGDDGTAPAKQNTTLSFGFEEDTEGWALETTEIDWGKAIWVDRGRGLLHLDGVGDSDSGPNAWAWKVVEIPPDASTLKFDSSAHDRGNGTGWLRLRLVDESGSSHTLVPLHVMSTGDEGFEFETRSADISAFAGTTVTLYFELEDGDGGANNQRYIDVVEIRS